VRRNIWKDHATIVTPRFWQRARNSQKKHILFVGLGEEAATEWVGNVEFAINCRIRATRKLSRATIKRTDIDLHAARADTFPRAVIEALACGTPVVATAVGGIPEQIKGLKYFNSASAVS
jgi:glycosyltransferase involved in cell wall biosynthesis